MSFRDALGAKRRLPVLLQMEAAECGLACLAMIGIYHGHRITLPALRRRFAVSRRGINMSMLIGLAEEMKLTARAVKLPIHSLHQLQLPCILHWGMDHFVVLKRVATTYVEIHDPALGMRRIDADELSQRFTGIAMELWTATDFTPIHDERRVSLRSVIGRIVGLRRGLIQVLLLTVALELVVILLPFQMQWLIDDALPSADLRLITVIGIGFLLMALLQAALTAFRGWVIVRISAHMNFQWQGNVFRHLMKLPLDYFSRRHIGTILTNLESVNAIEETITRSFAQVLVDGLLAVGTLAMLCIYSTRLTAVVLAALLIYTILRVLTYGQLRAALAERYAADGKIYTHFMESVRGIQAIRLLGGVQQRVMIWRNLLADRFNALMRGNLVGTYSHAARVLLFGMENVIVVWLGVLAILNNQFTVGMLFVYINYKQQFTQRMSDLIDKAVELRLLRLHADRVADIVHGSPERVTALESVATTKDFVPTIELINVSFRYGTTEELIINNVSLRIGKGECVAIAGSSGCGKTTLVKIMLGLLQATSGEVRVSGVSLATMGVGPYRRRVAAVMQDDLLFSGSIADNICFFDPQPDITSIETCARQAAIHDDILGMPMGYNTLIGDVGTGLSGGQAQRVLLARAFYRQPAILFLDEATSHLDVWNERTVNDAIKGMQLTRIVVAHRPETIAMADRVIYMQAGQIVQAQSAHAQAGQ